MERANAGVESRLCVQSSLKEKDEVTIEFDKNCVGEPLKQNPGHECSDDEGNLINLMELPMLMMKEKMRVSSPMCQEAKQVGRKVLRIKSPGQIWVQPLTDYGTQFQLLPQRSGTKLGQLLEVPSCEKGPVKNKEGADSDGDEVWKSLLSRKERGDAEEMQGRT